MTKTRLLAYSALIANTIIWALAFPIVKMGFNFGLTPTFFLFARFAIALIFSLPILFWLLATKSVRKQITFKNIITIIALELLGTFAALWLLYEGVAHTSAIASSLIAITWPVFVVLGGIWFLHEHQEKHEWKGLALAIAGTLFLVLAPLFQNGFRIEGSAFGNFLILSQNLAIAAYYLLAKKFYKNLNKWLVTHISFWVGTISFGTVLIVTKAPLIISGTWPLISVFYMAIFGSIIALTLYLLGQNKIEASEASLFTYLQPILSLPLAIYLLGETLSPIHIIGSFLILTGVFIAEKKD